MAKFVKREAAVPARPLTALEKLRRMAKPEVSHDHVQRLTRIRWMLCGAEVCCATVPGVLTKRKALELYEAGHSST